MKLKHALIQIIVPTIILKRPGKLRVVKFATILVGAKLFWWLFITLVNDKE